MTNIQPRVEDATIARLLCRRFTSRPEGVFVVWDDYEGDVQRWSYAEAADEIRWAAGKIQGLVGNSGSPVLLIGSPSPALLFYWLACLATGIPVAAINPTVSLSELATFVTALSPVGIIHEPLLSDLVGTLITQYESSLGALPISTMPRDEVVGGWPDYWRQSLPTDRAGFIFTSGTTGAPKAVILSQANYAWGSTVCSSYFRLRNIDRLAVLLPLYHVNAQIYSVLSAIQAAASIVMAPRLSVSRFWDLAGSHSVTKVSMSIFGMEVIARAGRPPEATLELAASGTQLSKWVEGWGTEVISMYGSSETVAPPIVGSTFEGVPEGYIGSATPFYSVRVVPDSESSGRVQGALEVLGIPGRTMAEGYIFPDGEFHRLNMTDDGWYRTGDVVECDEEGWFRILGRADDVLKVRGENVSPAEIEGAIRGSHGVEDVAVVGVSDAIWGHIPVAVLELSDSAQPEDVTRSVLAQLKERITGHKHPQLLLATSQLPRSDLNKVRKSVVRESLDTYDELWRSAGYESRG